MDSPDRRLRPRKLEWALVAVALAGGALLLAQRGRPLRAGETLRESLTLITADRYDLACASNRVVRGFRCQYDAPGAPVLPPPDYAQVLVPYVTTHGQLFFIPGLFAEPALAARLAKEPPQGKPREALLRFDARCDLTLVKRIKAAARFGRSGAFNNPETAWVATVSDCEVSR